MTARGEMMRLAERMWFVAFVLSWMLLMRLAAHGNPWFQAPATVLLLLAAFKARALTDEGEGE